MIVKKHEVIYLIEMMNDVEDLEAFLTTFLEEFLDSENVVESADLALDITENEEYNKRLDFEPETEN